MATREPGHGWDGRPARSGADTPRSTDIIQHGGKVDPDALLRRMQQAKPDAAEEDSPPALKSIAASEDDQVVAASGADGEGGVADEDAPNRVVFVLRRDLDKRLDKYLTDRITFMSRTQLQRLIDEGGVSVNARKAKASTKLRAGDRVEVFVPPPPPTEIQPEDIPLNVLYEDAQLIVINKTPDIIVHPARAHNRGTMVNALAFHFQNRSHSGGALSGVGKEFARPGVVHRLDRQTSGLIVFAKSDEAHWRIGQQFEKRTVDKRYLALVHGLYEPPIDTIDLPLGPHRSREKGYREMYVVRHDNLGKPSLTIARVRQQFRAPQGSDLPGKGFSLVELELKTGRTHQIRVHLTHRGFPIVGDDMYGGKFLWRTGGAGGALGVGGPGQVPPGGDELVGRVALHAATLAFRHPIDGRPMAFQAPLPADMARTLGVLRDMDKLSAVLTPPGATVSMHPES